MNTWTLGELKKAIADCPELADDTPVYYALESFAHSGKGGSISLVGYENGMDEEDKANLL